MSYLVDPNAVAAHGRSINAGRVCLRSPSGDFQFSDTTDSAVNDLLYGQTSGRYKFQQRIEGRWSDISGYSPVLDARRLLSDAARAIDAGGTPADNTEFRAAIAQEPRRFHAALRTNLRLLQEGLSHNPRVSPIRRLRAYFEPIASEVEEDHLTYFLTMLRLMETAIEAGVGEALDARRYGEGRDVYTSMIEETARAWHYYALPPGKIAVENMLGKIASLFDRPLAEKHFLKMRQLDVSNLVPFFYIDMGALTFFSSTTIGTSGARANAQKIRGSVVAVTQTGEVNDVAVVISADPHFFRIYAHFILFYAQQLPEVDFIITLCADPGDADEAISAAEAYVDGLIALNGMRRPNNVAYFRVPVPDFVSEPRTFYATARFFMPDILFSSYDRLFLMDIDLAITDDPRDYLRSATERPFTCSDNRGIPRLSPWRRHLAGNIGMNQAIPQEFLADLTEYIAHGLEMPNSWMLDQNALTYAIERHFPLDAVTVDGMARPTAQPRFRSVWEANFSRARDA